MSLFDWLVVAHVVGDFLLQSGTMAARKTDSWSWMAAHVGLYMIPVAAVCVGYALSTHSPVWLLVMVLAFLAGSHAVLDRRGIRDGWMRLVGIPVDHPWLPNAVDQGLHLVTLALAAQALVLVGR